MNCLIEGVMNWQGQGPLVFMYSFLYFYIFSYNSDGLSLMDVAVLTNNTEMVKLLIQHGAREGMECKLMPERFVYRPFVFCFADWKSFWVESDGSKESLNLHLVQLLNEAEKQLEEKSQPSSSPVRVDLDKHVALWKRRVRILRKMKSGLEQLSEFSYITWYDFVILKCLSSIDLIRLDR